MFDNKLNPLIAISFLVSLLQTVFYPIHYLTYICSAFLCIVMIPHYHRLNKQTLIFRFILIYFCFLLIRGVLSGNFINYIIFDLNIYTAVIFIAFFVNVELTKNTYTQFPVLFAKLLLISIPFFFFIFLHFGNLSLGDEFARSLFDEDNSSIDRMAFIIPLSMAPLLVPFINDMKPSLKYVVIFASILYLLTGILTATRSVILINLISYLPLLSFKRLLKNKILIIIISSSIFVLIVLFSGTEIFSLLGNRLDYTFLRFSKESDYSSGRDTEVKGLFKEFNSFDLVFGRGTGAEQKFGFWKDIKTNMNEHGVNYTHFGFLYFILKGGFILLFIVYGLAFYSLFVLFRNGERKYFTVILLYLVAETSFTQFINYFYVLFLWVSISLALRLSINSKSNNKIILRNL